jgi:hemerythrin-like domain-containing protein
MTDTTDMLAVHDCFRREFARLPITVKAVGDGDVERATAIGEHIIFMCDFLHAHHESEDLLVWPLLQERAPEADALVGEMVEQHEQLLSKMGTARQQAQAWIDDPGNQERAALHTTLIALEKELLHHLAVEEQQVLPLIARDLTPEEWFAVGQHSRESFSQQDLTIALGLILDNTSAERGEVILEAMPPEARAGFEQFGRPAYLAYRDRLRGN